MNMNAADTAWVLVSTALVLLMTPALAFFHGGLVRPKNSLNTMMMSFISLGFVGGLYTRVGNAKGLRPRRRAAHFWRLDYEFIESYRAAG